MDITSLEPVVLQLFSAGIASSTQRVYRTGTNRYVTFCSKFALTPFPVSELKLCYFVAHIFNDGVSGRTAKTYLSGIRHSQIALGLGDPNMSSMPQLEYVTKGHRKLKSPGAASTRLPITSDILRKIRRVWEFSSVRFDACMLWAASCMCFFGFLRAGEIVVPSDVSFDPAVHLAYGDVRVDNQSSPSCLEVHLKSSKTDPFRQGVSVYLGRTSLDLCPVAAILAYMVERGSASGVFFRFRDGRPLTRDRFITAMRAALSEAGVDASRYAGHSFRIGAATTAALQGIPDSLIKTLGRWESSAYTVYIRTPREVLCSVATLLLGSS